MALCIIICIAAPHYFLKCVSTTGRGCLILSLVRIVVVHSTPQHSTLLCCSHLFALFHLLTGEVRRNFTTALHYALSITLPSPASNSPLSTSLLSSPFFSPPSPFPPPTSPFSLLLPRLHPHLPSLRLHGQTPHSVSGEGGGGEARSEFTTFAAAASAIKKKKVTRDKNGFLLFEKTSLFA